MTRRQARLIAVGAGVGATTRWALGTALEVGVFPTATLLANLVGCALLGWLTARPLDELGRQEAATVGFCGGLTTFSTLAVELAELRGPDPAVFVWYLAASVIGGVALFVGGRSVAR